MKWILKLLGGSTYLATIIAIYQCLTCTDCGGALHCVSIVLGGGSIGTALMFAKPNAVTGGTIPATIEAIRRTEGSGAAPVKG